MTVKSFISGSRLGFNPCLSKREPKKAKQEMKIRLRIILPQTMRSNFGRYFQFIAYKMKYKLTDAHGLKVHRVGTPWFMKVGVSLFLSFLHFDWQFFWQFSQQGPVLYLFNLINDHFSIYLIYSMASHFSIQNSFLLIEEILNANLSSEKSFFRIKKNSQNYFQEGPSRQEWVNIKHKKTNSEINIFFSKIIFSWNQDSIKARSSCKAKGLMTERWLVRTPAEDNII